MKDLKMKGGNNVDDCIGLMMGMGLTIVALGLAVGCVFGFLGALDRSEYATGQCAIKQGRIGPAPPGAVKCP